MGYTEDLLKAAGKVLSEEEQSLFSKALENEKVRQLIAEQTVPKSTYDRELQSAQAKAAEIEEHLSEANTKLMQWNNWKDQQAVPRMTLADTYERLFPALKDGAIAGDGTQPRDPQHPAQPGNGNGNGQYVSLEQYQDGMRQLTDRNAQLQQALFSNMARVRSTLGRDLTQTEIDRWFDEGGKYLQKLTKEQPHLAGAPLRNVVAMAADHVFGEAMSEAQKAQAEKAYQDRFKADLAKEREQWESQMAARTAPSSSGVPVHQTNPFWSSQDKLPDPLRTQGATGLLGAVEPSPSPSSTSTGGPPQQDGQIQEIMQFNRDFMKANQSLMEQMALDDTLPPPDEGPPAGAPGSAPAG